MARAKTKNNSRNNFLWPPRSPKQIKKRGGHIVKFDPDRIKNAIFKAFEASGQPDMQAAKEVARRVVEKIIKKHKSPKSIPAIEQVQDIVEETLIELGYAKIAKSYILYRQKRAEIRKEKKKILDSDEIDEVDKKFDANALRVLRSRYLRKNEQGKVIESPKELFMRVAIHAALPELIYDKRVSKKTSKPQKPSGEHMSVDAASKVEGDLKVGDYVLNRFHIRALHYLFLRFEQEGKTKISWEKMINMLKRNQFKDHASTIDNFNNLMVLRKFMPNTPAIANFGSYLGMGSACFVLGIDDSMDSIMDTLKDAAMIHKSGGGTGFNFSNLRPEGDFIKKTGGTSSGPISFMRLYDFLTEVVKQGGIRRGANMGIMNSNHPDVEKFIMAKEGNKTLRNFNISVLIMPDFWDYYKEDKPYPLVNPRTKEVVRTVSPKALFDQIVYQAWESAEPGVIFYDHVNKYNPFLKSLGPIVTTNPCGEVLLYSNESCNLGSINVWAFVKHDGVGKNKIEWDEMEKSVRIATRLLDNIIDINNYPLKKIEEMTLKTRKIGLGIMGLGDFFYELGISFSSQKARNLMEKLGEFVNYHSKVESIDIARTRGPLPLFKKSFYSEGKLPFAGFYDKKSWNFDWNKIVRDTKKYGIRNGFTTVIAPTGSISMIAGCSSGIEPVYALVFKKNVAVGSFYYVDPVFERIMLREGLFDEALLKDVVKNNGSVQNISYIPPELKKIFVTAHDISPEDHIRTLAAFQKWVDSSISKTNNFPANATADHMRKSYLLAYELGCKDVTVFRDTSIQDQVLVAGETKKAKTKEHGEMVRMKDEKAEGLAIYRDPSNGNSLSPITASKAQVDYCPNCGVALSHKEGCITCPSCGWGLC